MVITTEDTLWQTWIKGMQTLMSPIQLTPRSNITGVGANVARYEGMQTSLTPLTSSPRVKMLAENEYGMNSSPRNVDGFNGVNATGKDQSPGNVFKMHNRPGSSEFTFVNTMPTTTVSTATAAITTMVQGHADGTCVTTATMTSTTTTVTSSDDHSVKSGESAEGTRKSQDGNHTGAPPKRLNTDTTENAEASSDELGTDELIKKMYKGMMGMKTTINSVNTVVEELKQQNNVWSEKIQQECGDLKIFSGNGS